MTFDANGVEVETDPAIISGEKTGRRKITAAGRRRMSEAGKRRWAKKREDKTNGEIVSVGAMLKAGQLCLELRTLVGTPLAIKLLETFESSLGGGDNA